MQINWILLFSTLLLVNIELSCGKRSFGFGRSRPKSNSNLSVRRRGHVPETPKAPPAPKQTHTAHASSHSSQTHAASAPQGPPPAYSVGPSAGKTSLNAAPPAYSQHGAAPPSYSAATGLGSHNGYSGVNSGTNLHQSAPGSAYGWNTHGGHNSYGGGNAHHGGYAQPNQGFGGHPSGGGYGGGGYGAMPNYGGQMGGGMMGGGMMGGGMMGQGVQPIYMQQQKSGGLLSGVGGYALSGLAGYQLARAFSGSGSQHHSEQHIHHHYDNNNSQASAQAPALDQSPPAAQAPQAPQGPQAPQQTLQTHNQNTQNTQTPYAQPIPLNPAVPAVPLAPFPEEETSSISPDCKENCTSESNTAATPVPEIDNEFPFSTIHPSLFLYASPYPKKNLEYWAKSVNKKLNIPDTSNSSPQTTTSP